MDPITIASGVAGLVGGIGGLFSRGKANRELKRLLKKDPQYQISDMAKQRLGLAQTLLNARAPGALAAERNIYGTQANTMAGVERNATSGAQALSLNMSAQGQTNQAFQNLAQNEATDYYSRLQNLTGAQQGMIAEEDKVYQDNVRRFQNQVQIKGAIAQNNASAWSSLTNLGMAGMNLGLSGAFGGQPGAAGSAGYVTPSNPQASAFTQGTTPMYSPPNVTGIIR